MSGYTGLAFPLRLNNKGGLQMSSTSPSNADHIIESIHQIIGTNMYERVMETYFGSRLSSSLFQDNDISIHSLIKFEILNALAKFEPRIEVEPDDITLDHEENILHITINFRVTSYGNDATTVVSLGGE